MKKLIVIFSGTVVFLVLFLYLYPHYFLKMFSYMTRRALKGDFEESERYFSEENLIKNISRDPNNENHLLNLGTYYLGKAITFKADNNFSDKYREYLENEYKRYLEKAKNLFEQTLLLNQNSIGAHKGLAKIYFLEDDCLNSLSNYAFVLERIPSDFEALYYSGVCLQKLKKEEQAKLFFQNAKEAAEKDKYIKETFEYKKLLEILQ